MKFWLYSLLVIAVSPIAQARTLVVISGGYNSCPASGELVNVPHAPNVFQVHDAAADFVAALKRRDPDVRILWSCFSGVIRDGSLAHIAQTGTLTFHYGMLPSRRPLGSLKFSGQNIDDGRPLKRYFDFVQQVVSASHPHALYVAGHSYGGWTVLQAGIRLAQQGVRMNGVFLLDPISPFQCGAHVLFFNTAFFWTPPEGCQTAPRDLRHTDMEALEKHSDWRTSLYQTQFERLHASPLIYPGWENREMIYRGWYLFGDTHTYMGTEKRAWNVAKVRVERE